jgi:hypothetical protein
MISMSVPPIEIHILIFFSHSSAYDVTHQIVVSSPSKHKELPQSLFVHFNERGELINAYRANSSRAIGPEFAGDENYGFSDGLRMKYVGNAHDYRYHLCLQCHLRVRWNGRHRDLQHECATNRNYLHIGDGHLVGAELQHQMNSYQSISTTAVTRHVVKAYSNGLPLISEIFPGVYCTP